MNNKYNWNGKKILIVEDDDSSFLYISVLFRNNGATIMRSSDGLDGFFHCMTNVPDLVIMDIRLPILNGLETIRLIKKYQPKIPVISMSAGVMPEEQNNCLNAGSDAFIPKPILPNDLLPVINYFLAKHKYSVKQLYDKSFL
jgi:two-component system, cell cycle response regulator DivK